MKKVLKEKFPNWVWDISEDNKLILTNDLDSLFTVALLKHLFGCEVELFYDFQRLYSKQPKFDKSNVIGCDLAIEDHKVKTFCNHVTKMWKDDTVNPLSANLNNIGGIHGGMHGSNYFKKYNGSTALTVLSLYGAFDKLVIEGKKELTEEQKLILVSIDSYFWGAYHPAYYEANEYFYKWQKALELEMFNDIFSKYSKAEITEFQRIHKLKGNIYMGHGLETSLNLNFLHEHFPMLDFSMNHNFKSSYTFDKPIEQQFYTKQSKHDLNGHIFSLAVTNRNRVKITRFKKGA